MRIRSIAAVMGVATALAGAQSATAHDDAGTAPPPDASALTPCVAIDLRQAEPDNPACADLPRFKASFLNRVWRFNASVDGYRGDALSTTLDSIERLPARFRNQDDELLDQDMYALLAEQTRVYDPDGRLVDQHVLAHAETVQVRGRLLRPRKWRANEDGDVVPTVRAKRVHVTAWVAGYDPSADASSDDDPCAARVVAATDGAEGGPACW